jgi:hypothetical protein
MHYSLRGSGRGITVQAQSSAEARRVVMQVIPGATCNRRAPRAVIRIGEISLLRRRTGANRIAAKSGYNAATGVAAVV